MKGAGALSARVRAGQQQGVRGGSYPRECSLCQGSRRTLSRAILFGCMKGLPRRRENLRTFLGRHAPLEDGPHLPQGSPGEADNDISIHGLRSSYGQANDPTPRKAKTRTTDKMRYKAH